MLDIEHKSFLLCWSKSRVGYDIRVPELSTPKISDIHSTALPQLNSFHTTHNGEFFIKLIHSFDQSIGCEDHFSVLHLMKSVGKILSDYGLESVDCIKRIHLAYQDEITKWELMAILFMLEILVKPDEFTYLVRPSSHRVYLTPIIFDIIRYSIAILRNDRIHIPSCISSPSRMNMMLVGKEIEVESLRAKMIDLKSEILRYQDAIEYKKHAEDTEQILYSDILTLYLDAIYQLERKTAETISLSTQIEKLYKEIVILNDAYHILQEQNLALQDSQRNFHHYENELIKLRQIQSSYSDLQQTYTLTQENVKQLNHMNHELRFKLSISEAKNFQSALLYQELQDHVRKNLHLSDVIEDYEKEILRYKGEITHKSVHSVQNTTCSISNTPVGIKHREVFNTSFYEEFDKLISSKEEKINSLQDNVNMQSTEILSLKEQLLEASNQLSLRDDLIHDLKKSIKSTSTSAYIQELKRRDAESDKKLNECRRRSSGISGTCINRFITPDSCKLYPDKMDCSFNSKVSRLDINPFGFASVGEVSKLSPINSENCPSNFDSEIKEREITTVKEKSKRFWDELDSVHKRK